MDIQTLYEMMEAVEVRHQEMSRLLQDLRDNMQELLQNNIDLLVENTHLRHRLEALENETPTPAVSGKRAAFKNLAHLYDAGFHICRLNYGSRRDGDCLLCDHLLHSQDAKASEEKS